MKKIFLTIFVLIVSVIVGFACYISYNYLKEKNSLQFTPISLSQNNASPTDSLGNSSSTDLIATSTVDTSLWKSYSNQELGYSLRYPSDLIFNRDESSLILAFPKKSYFSWPLEDNVKITIFASSTCASENPQTLYDIKPRAGSLFIGGKKFILKEIHDVAMGNRYNVRSYEMTGNNICYSLVYYSHGANGAGLYVDDSILIKKYDENHAINQKKVDDILIGILSTFNLD